MAQTRTSHSVERRICLLRREIDGLAQPRTSACHDISALEPARLATHALPDAKGRLGAVLRSSEDAALHIIAEGEALLALAEATAATQPGLAGRISEIALSIIEAAAFQDVTGQHVRRVLDLLHLVEARLARLAEIVGDDERDTGDAAPVTSGTVGASGPDWTGSGNAQSAVDRLFAQAGP